MAKAKDSLGIGAGEKRSDDEKKSDDAKTDSLGFKSPDPKEDAKEAEEKEEKEDKK